MLVLLTISADFIFSVFNPRVLYTRGYKEIIVLLIIYNNNKTNNKVHNVSTQAEY